MTHLLLSKVKWEVPLAVEHEIPSGLSIRPFFPFFWRRKLTCHAQARKSPCIKDPLPFTLASAVKSLWYAEIFPVHSPDGYAMLMSPNKGETAVHGCHCLGNMAARMRELPVRPWVGVCVPLALSLSYKRQCKSNVYMKHYPNIILRNIMVFSAMVYLDSKRAYRPTSTHSPNQQIQFMHTKTPMWTKFALQI